MTDAITHEIELPFGYTDKKGVRHTKVVFGKRPSVGDLLLLDSNPTAQNIVQREQLVRRQMITRFGDLMMPVPLDVLAKLDTIDDDLLRRSANDFLIKSRDGRKAEYEADAVKLMFGIEIDGVTYDTVEFGNRLTVGDNIEAGNRGLGDGVALVCFQIGQQISQLRSSETKFTLDGQLDSEKFSDMDSEDLNALLMGAELFRHKPREKGSDVPGDDGGEGAKPGTHNGVDGGNDRQDAN